MRYVVHWIRKGEAICIVSAGAIAIWETGLCHNLREDEFVGME